MSDAASRGADQRRARRAALKLRGRFLLADGGEHPCESIDASVTGVALRAYVSPLAGERIVLYLDGLGRLEGLVASLRPDGFVLELTSPASRTEKLAQKLAALAGAEENFARQDSRASSFRRAELRVEFGQTFHVSVGEETATSARIYASFSLLPGARVFLDGRRASVTHESSGGFVIGF